MAKIRAMIGSGGGGEALVETVLWTNPSPSSNFSAQTITLSQSMSDFDMLRFEIRTHVSSPTTSKSIYVPLSYFNSTSSGANAYKLVLGVYQFTNLYARETYKSSDTQIYISEARRLNASGTSTDQTIPYKIYGVKKSTSGSNCKSIYLDILPSYQSGVNTYTFNMSDYDIDASLSLKRVVLQLLNSNNIPYTFYLRADSNTYDYTAGNSSTGYSKRACAYPSTSNNRMGFNQSNGVVTLSFYEISSSVTGFTGNMILIFE